MLESITEGLVLGGGLGYAVGVPILRALATLFMVISTYKLLRLRDDSHKALWVIGIIIFPIVGRITYEIYRRFIYIDKKDESRLNKRSSNRFLLFSILLYVVALILSAVSLVSFGVGFIKSYIDGDPVNGYYDVHGTEYFFYTDVPLFDEDGNKYFYEKDFGFEIGDYVDEDGNVYENENSFLSEDGYFYYDKDDILTPYRDEYGYFTDGETIYYDLFNYVYWNEDGVMFDKSTRVSEQLFDFDEE